MIIMDIKQIEIVKGPSSSLYGSEAIGGVINIITNKLNRDVSKGNFQYYAKGGKRNELDLNTNYIYKKNKFGIKAGLNLNSGGAFDVSPKTVNNTTEPYKNFTGTLDINYDINDKIKFIQSNRFYKPAR